MEHHGAWCEHERAGLGRHEARVEVTGLVRREALVEATDVEEASRRYMTLHDGANGKVG